MSSYIVKIDILLKVNRITAVNGYYTNGNKCLCLLVSDSIDD